MNKLPNNGDYVAPEINEIEVESLEMVCTSPVGSGSEGYDPTDYQW